MQIDEIRIRTQRIHIADMANKNKWEEIILKWILYEDMKWFTYV